MDKTDWLARTDHGFLAEAFAYTNGDARVGVAKYFETDDQAAEFAAQFPKSYGIKLSHLSGGSRPAWRLAAVRATFRFQSNGSTGEKNETAIRRFLAFERKCRALGVKIDYDTSFYTNSIDRAGLDEFLV